MAKNNESGKKSKALPVTQNLRSLTFPSQLDWSPNQIAASLERVYEFVNNECREAIGWYYHKKNSKKFLGVFLRIGAIFAAAVAGVIPIIGEIFKEGDVPLISPAWSTIFLTIAAVLVALDQFGGATSGWVRYIKTAQKLKILQGNFRHDWELFRLELSPNENGVDKAQKGIGLCREFLLAVNSEIQAETNIWAQEFQQALIDIETSTKGTDPSE